MSGQRVGMKPGEAFKIRLLPREIMVCAAVVREIAPDARGLSLAQVVRVAVTELCEAAVRSKLVPEPDEFDYDMVTAEFRRGVALARKVQTGRVLLQGQMERVSAGGTAAFGGLTLGEQNSGPLTEGEITATQERTLRALAADDPKAAAQLRRTLIPKRDPRRLRRDELAFRSEQDPANMSKEEFRELRRLQKELGASA